MESSREGCHSLEFQDETGLELSLGLSLSSADSRSKWKASEGASARSSPSVDLAGEPSAGVTLNGMHSVAKPKPPNKPGGLDAALKKFLEGRLDDHEDNAKFLDGSNSFVLHKEKDKTSPVGSQERPSQQLDMGMDADKGNPFLFKELQGSSGLTASRGQSPAHTTPLQLVDAFKNSPFGSNSGSPHSAEGPDNFDGEDATQENSEQHKKFQDAQKKRNLLIEEQKHPKRGKKEEKPGTHGFCRPGSNTLASASAIDMDKALQGFRGDDDGNKQFQQDASQEKQDSAEGEKGYESDGDESTGFGKNVSADLGQHDTKGTSDESKGIEVNFMPQLKAPETLQKTANRPEDDNPWPLTMMKSDTTASKLQDREMSSKRVSTSLNIRKDGQALLIKREGDKAGSPLQGKRERVPSETSSVSTGGTEKLEEKSRGEASSSVPEVMGSDKAPPPVSMLATSFCPPAATISSASLPYPLSPYPVVSIPYSLPVSMPHAPGMPFPVSVNFPYVMQYLPPGSENTEQNPTRPVGNNVFQLPGIEYPPPQLSALEGTSWIQALRPPVAPFTNASNGALYSRNGMGVVAEDANSRLQVVTRMQDNGMVGTSIAADTSSLQNQPLFRAAVRSGSQDQVPEAPMLSSLPIPAVPHFSSHLGIPDHGELRTSKEQNGMSTFPGFAATVQAAQAHPSPGPVRPPSSGGAKEDARQEQAKFGGRSIPPVLQQHVQNRNTMEPSNLGQEEFRRVVGSQFHQGSTENLSFVDGLGEDMAFLQCGLAPGLKFGGTGTAPDLPWVHTTGPNGQTIGGVLYRLSRTQLRVVCACHGKHMSPVEFAQHASGVDVSSTDRNVAVNSPLTTHAT